MTMFRKQLIMGQGSCRKLVDELLQLDLVQQPGVVLKQARNLSLAQPEGQGMKVADVGDDRLLLDPYLTVLQGS
jgi:hypothetical protein